MIKLIAIDMDGTLLNENKHIDKAQKEAIHEAIEAGIKIVLCTGRPLYGILPFYKELGLHEFDLEGTCEFMVIRFGEQYINHYQFKDKGHIACLLYYTSHLPGAIVLNADDKIMIASLMGNLRMISEHQSLYVEELMHHLVHAIIVLVAKNIAIINPPKISSTTDIRLMEILDYIQANICKPELLKIAVIAEKFGLSPNYLGHYFRKHCNESIQQYISSYRIRLIEHRLRFSDKRVHEIADEFGFTDESHINKFFKRYHGISLKKYRIASLSI